jgi:hypothetical protein
LPTRGWLAGLVRTERRLTGEEAEKTATEMPCIVGENLTRGQAEDLLARLARERVTARLRSMEQNTG